MKPLSGTGARPEGGGAHLAGADEGPAVAMEADPSGPRAGAVDQATVPPRRPPSWTGWGPRGLAVLSVLAAVATRVWFLRTPQAVLNGDEAMTGLMVARILHGHFYIFFGGQSYDGTLDQYLQALVYLVTGLPRDAFSLRLVMVLYGAVDCALIYLVGARMLKTRWHGALAALLFAAGPYWNIWFGVRSYGSSYGSALTVALAGLYAALRLRGTGRSRGSLGWAVAFGLCCGLDLWLGPTGAYLLIPAAFWALAWAIRSGRVALAAAAGVAAGAAPVIVWIAWHGRLPNLGGPQPPTSLAQRWAVLAGRVVREWLGGGFINATPGWPPPLQTAAVGVLALAWLGAVVVRRRGLAALVSLRLPRQRGSGSQPVDLLVLAVPVAVILYLSSPNAWYGGTPRYLFLAYPILVLGLAALVPARVTAGAPLALVILAGLAGTSLTMIGDHASTMTGPSAGELGAAAAYLGAHGDRYVYSDYWTGLPLQYVAGGRLTVGVEGPGLERLPYLRHAVDAAPRYAYVAASGPEDSLAATRAALVTHGVRYHLARFGAIYVFDRLRPELRPWQLGIGTRMSATDG